MKWAWLDRRVVEAIQVKLIQRHGGRHGIRDDGMLESALMRPQNRAAYGKPTVHDLAASYAFGIARDHPFVDGNKRAAFVAAALFLRMNGQMMRAEQAEAAVVFLRLAAGEVGEEELAAWLEENCVSSDPPEADVPKQQ